MQRWTYILASSSAASASSCLPALRSSSDFRASASAFASASTCAASWWLRDVVGLFFDPIELPSRLPHSSVRRCCARNTPSLLLVHLCESQASGLGDDADRGVLWRTRQ